MAGAPRGRAGRIEALSQLVLVRHGQATPFDTDTDRLSALGENQARAVGEALAEQGLEPTRVLSGPLSRQLDTARLATQPEWPEPELDARLAEYDGDGLLRVLAPLLAAREPGFDALLRDLEAGRDLSDRNRRLQKLLERLAEAWRTGEVTHPDVEPWPDFRARVRAWLRDLLAGPSGETVLAFTSGGVIGLTVAGVLEAPERAALALNWRVKNASLTRLTFGGGRISLDSFNETAHLNPDLITWR